MCGFSPSSPSAWMACGVFATGKSLRIALLTPTSVACADRITATSNSKAVVYSNSVVGFGFSARRRENNSTISSRVSLLPRTGRGLDAGLIRGAPALSPTRVPVRLPQRREVPPPL